MGTPHRRLEQVRNLTTTNDVTKIEAQRLREQERLDAERTAAERNQLGQFATPALLAQDIAIYAHNLWPDERAVRFLDPAIGTGSFYSAVRHIFPPASVEFATGAELDDRFVVAARTLWGDGLRVVEGDFTLQVPPQEGERYNLVLTNPPYVRHHHLDRAQKGRLQAAVVRNLGIEISGLAGLYCYFLLLAHAWMDDDALAVWLIPTEFMEVNYGAALKRYLAERVTLLHIHRYCPTAVQFGDALVTSAVVVFRKTPPGRQHTVRFSFGDSLNHPTTDETVPLPALRASAKWTNFPRAPGRRETRRSGVTLADLFTIKRGIATGANGFFILPRSEAREIGIPESVLRPILPSPRYVRASVIDRQPDGYPAIDQPLALIDSPLPEEEVRTRYPRFWAYLERGKAESVHTGYLASRRLPWYAQEQRPAAPFLCTYMGRRRDDGNAFRFLWNRSDATAPNVYLLLYPREPLASALRRQPSLHEKVLAFLQGIDAASLVGEGRVYGGGLYKVEPKELGRVPGGGLLGSIGEIGIHEQIALALDAS